MAKRFDFDEWLHDCRHGLFLLGHDFQGKAFHHHLGHGLEPKLPHRVYYLEPASSGFYLYDLDGPKGKLEPDFGRIGAGRLQANPDRVRLVGGKLESIGLRKESKEERPAWAALLFLPGNVLPRNQPLSADRS